MNYNDIGQRIRVNRKANGLTQEQLAEKCDITTTHMSHIETGNTKLSLPVLVKVANALQVTTDELLCDNTVASRAVFVNEIASTLDQCTEIQVRILTEIIKAAKASLDKHASS